jgi:hypothetical protein
MFHSLLHLGAAKSYVPYQDLESTSMMIALLDSPDLVFDHIRRFTTSLFTQIIYGFRTPRIDDPMLLRLYEGVEKWSAITGAGAAALLDVFPILRSLPAAIRPLYNHALDLQRDALGLALELWRDSKKRSEEKTAKVNLTSSEFPLLSAASLTMSSPAILLCRPRQSPSRGRPNGRCRRDDSQLGIGGEF